MARGGRRPGAGRPKGSKSKTTLAAVARAREAEAPSSPSGGERLSDAQTARQASMFGLKVLIEIAGDRKAPTGARVAAAGKLTDLALPKIAARPAPPPPAAKVEINYHHRGTMPANAGEPAAEGTSEDPRVRLPAALQTYDESGWLDEDGGRGTAPLRLVGSNE